MLKTIIGANGCSNGLPTADARQTKALPAIVSKGAFKLLSDFKPEPVDWLWRGRIPLGELTILDGDPSTNKSSLTLDIAARVSTGREMPDGTDGPDGGVLVLQAEDSIRKTLLLRAKAAGANLDRIVVIEQAVIPDDLDRIQAAIRQVSARLWVIDPLLCFLRQDANKEQSVRQALMPLREVAEQRNIAVVMVRHLNKSGGRNALYRGTGSIAITAAIRSGFLVAPSPGDPHLRVLCHWKSNLGPTTASLLFEPVSTQDGQVRIEWRGECEYSARELFASPQNDRCVRNLARKVLHELLANGPVEQRAVEEHAIEQGLSWRTVERAKADLGIVSRRKGFGPGSIVYWELPPSKADQESPSLTPPTTGLAVYDPRENQKAMGPFHHPVNLAEVLPDADEGFTDDGQEEEHSQH